MENGALAHGSRSSTNLYALIHALRRLSLTATIEPPMIGI